MVELKPVSVVLLVLIITNLLFVELARIGGGIRCPKVDYSFTNNTNYSFSFNDIVDLALGRCNGLPLIWILLIEIPLIAALLYAATHTFT